ncbi:Mitochondrial Rho GTPase 1 [Galdieria sulphuraria]|uniref:Mitochondrial Rho GTPase n=1 Tax=Galdieria sulphuraria TaxID=130081 RepID=M2XSJ9_GALSU|nr:Miro (mitochondrial Rho) protein (GTPase/ calcium ion binding) [Galdieria sulphuraria]EME26374.1 Miro (mitochondrial Rho) protein (GTPase/ calcium ion binding) [Galdieria sulphuraria]GJD11676.1 Mitochondrial Rho GTPase 1 [Galdieria sulphuraria]|eukprot:XP_005702894.1 Miro (mitochondrial Rho) protein (GTPase/ calcium ion binding) [Galdieria sulphuraria]
MKPSVRIVVVGDPKVGKSSLIKTLISESFEDEVQPVLPTVVIPPEVTPERVHVSIVDTSSSPEERHKLEEEIRKADVLVLVYDVSKRETLDRASSYWLPTLRRLGVTVPVVLVGNKIDVRGIGADHSLEHLIKPIMDEFREVDVCIECSAKQVFNIAELFYYAQKAVIHPTAPLYDVNEHTLKPKAVSALKRIFRLCDKDKDGVLNDEELNQFQYECFGVELKPKEREGVKNVVRDNTTDGLDANSCVTLNGFLYLHKLFIQKGRLETTWAVLRKFGYDDDLLLRPDYVKLDMKKADDQCVELSERASCFLLDLFDRTDKDKDGKLSEAECKELFSTIPYVVWDEEKYGVRLVEQGDSKITRDGFLDRWTLYLLDDPETALYSLVYLGYETEVNSAYVISRRRRRDRRLKSVSRHVFQVFVMGSPGCGKSSMLRSLVGLPFVEDHQPTVRNMAALRRILLPEEEGGGYRSLALYEIPEHEITSKLLRLVSPDGKKGETNKTEASLNLESCDVACLLYDIHDPKSFAYAARLYQNLAALRPLLPVVFVATKADLTAVSPHYEVSPADFCDHLGLPHPVKVSFRLQEDADIFQMLVGVGLHPQLACPGYYEHSAVVHYALVVSKILAASAAIGATVYVSKKIYQWIHSRE